MSEETEKLVKRRLALYGRKYGFHINGFSVGDMKKWAHCAKGGVLSFNWQLIGLPRELADYVILHELSHLKEFNHSKRFKYELGSVCPDFKERDLMLRRFVTE
jgi:predicted metal-dependent hydrolase